MQAASEEFPADLAWGAPCGVAPAAEPGVLTRISRILPGRVGLAEGLQPDGSFVLTFDVDRYAVELGRIEV